VVEAAARELGATYGSDVAEQPGYRDALGGVREVQQKAVRLMVMVCG